ncbi:unnamed protein product [Cunninghamella echinulata]
MPGNHSKKPSDNRRDSLKQQSQQQQQSYKKNSQGRPKDTHFNAKRHSHIGLNGFNTSEVSNFLSQRYSDTYTAYHNNSLDVSVRPVKYESQEKAWGNKGMGGSAWGQKVFK